MNASPKLDGPIVRHRLVLECATTCDGSIDQIQTGGEEEEEEEMGTDEKSMMKAGKNSTERSTARAGRVRVSE